MWWRISQSLQRFGPTLLLGLFGGRILSEVVARTMAKGAAGAALPRAIVLTLLATLLLGQLARRYPLRRRWSLLFLALYVFYPEPDPAVAMIALALTMVATFSPETASRDGAGHRDFSRLLGPGALVACLLIYLATVVPDVLPADSGEFQLVAANLGVAHPPGFPLYTLLAHGATRIPLALSPALKVTLFSTGISLGTLALVYLAVLRLTGKPVTGLIALAALATSTTFWSQATTANIRSLTTFFSALAFYLLLRFAGALRKPEQDERSPEMPTDLPVRQPDRFLASFALAYGLGIFHHASLLFLAPPFLAFVLTSDARLLTRPGRLIRPFLAALLGALPLLYLPWRGNVQANGATVRGASPALATISGFLDHALALGFRGDFFYFLETGELWQRFGVLANVMRFQFSPLLLLGMGFGLILMIWQNRRLALLFGGSFGLLAVAAASYRAPQTVEYMMPAYVPAVIVLGYAAGHAERLFGGRWRQFATCVEPCLVAALLVASFSQGAARFSSYRVLRQEGSARDYAQGLLEGAPPAATILSDWHWATPLWYMQEVEGLRPDVAVHFVFPTAEAYADTWARRIAEELRAGRPVIATHFDENAYASLPVPEPLGEAMLFTQEVRTSLPAGFVSFEQRLGTSLHILGYELAPRAIEAGQQATLTLAWQVEGGLPSPLSLFAHVVGQDGQIYAQEDPRAQPRDQGITLTQFRLTPRLGATPGTYQVMIGAYGTEPLMDGAGNARTPLTQIEVTAMTLPPLTQNNTYREVLDASIERRLVGFDWDDTLPGERRFYLHWETEEGFVTEVQSVKEGGAPVLPELQGPWGIADNNWPDLDRRPGHYVPFGQNIIWFGPLLAGDEVILPGEELMLEQIFRSSRPITRDIATSVRLIGYEEDGYHWSWFDSDEAFGIPAMGAIPTLKWISGSTIRDRHLVQVSPDAYAGQALGVSLALYDAFTNRPLPVLDERFTRETPWRLTIVSP